MPTKTLFRTAIATGAVAAASLALAATAFAAPVPRTGAGANAAAITPARDAYRADLGGGNTDSPPGAFGGLRREINWDGTPEPNSEPNQLAPNFFQGRGAIFAGAPGFMVSNNAPSRFNTLNATYSTAFTAFSIEKLFTPIGSTTFDVDFTVPGTTTPATSNGFGAIFADVDSASSSRIDYIGLKGEVIYSLPVPASGVPDGGFSFAGVTFNAGERITKARIVSGATAVTNTPLTSPADITQGGPGDVVVLDDFLYGEPKARTAASFKLGAVPKKLKLKKKKKKTLSVPFSNGGETAAENAQVCLNLSKKARKKVSVKGGSCQTIGTVQPGESKTAKLTVKSKKGKGSFSATLQLRANGVTPLNTSLKIKVSGKKKR